MTPCCETPILVLPGMIQLNSFGFKLVYSYRIIKTINSIFSIFPINLTVSQDIFTNLATVWGPNFWSKVMNTMLIFANVREDGPSMWELSLELGCVGSDG